jgi:hypothetical protein
MVEVATNPRSEWDRLLHTAELPDSTTHPEISGLVQGDQNLNELKQPIAVAGSGTNKSGVLVPNDECMTRPTNTTTVVGSKVHAAAAHNAEAVAEQEIWWNKRNAGVPFKVQYWSLLALDAFQRYYAAQRMPYGRSVTRVHESSVILMGEDRDAGISIENDLTREQANIRDAIGPLATALSLSPSPLSPGQQDGQFPGYVQANQNELPSDITSRVKKLSMFKFGHNGNLIYCPTARGDEVEMSYRTNDHVAKQISEQLAILLKSGKSLDPETLVLQQFVGQRGAVLEGYDIIFRAARLIKAGRMGFKVTDHKSMPHIGFSQELEKLWQQTGGLLPKLFSHSSLIIQDKPHKELRHKWQKYEEDGAISTLAYVNMFAYGLKGYYERNPHKNISITLEDIIPRIQTSIRLVDFPIVGYNSQNFNVTWLPAEEFSYDSTIPLSGVGVPKSVSIYEKKVANHKVHEYWRDWESRVYQQQLLRQFVRRRNLILAS